MENYTRHVYGAAVQAALLLDIPYPVMNFTTMNQKLGIQASTAIQPTDIPKLKIFCVGRGGHTGTMGSDGVLNVTRVQHRATDAALYSQMPLALRAIGADFDSATAAKYALRKVITVGSSNYIAYYGLRIDTSTATLVYKKNTVVAGSITASVPFVPSSANLTPTPPVTPPSSLVVTDGEYVTVQALISFNFDTAITAEFINAVTILYGSPDYATISELCLMTAVDKTITTEVGTTFNEVIGCQAYTSFNTFEPMNFNTGGTTFNIDIGGAEPLWILS